MMLNAAAAALAGAAHPDGIALARGLRAMGGNGRSTIIGMGQRTSPVYAALVNGALVRVLDFDDNLAGHGIKRSGPGESHGCGISGGHGIGRNARLSGERRPGRFRGWL